MQPKFLREGADSLLWLLYSGLGGTPQSYCDLESTEPPDILISREGSLGTALRVAGVKEVRSSATFAASAARLASDLSPLLEEAGRTIQLTFSWDPEEMVPKIRGRMAQSFATARRLGLDLGDVLDEDVRVMAQWTADEATHLVLWTHSTALPGRERRKAIKSRAKFMSENYPGAPGGQRWLLGLEELRDRHRTFVSTVRAAFEAAGLDVMKLDAHDILRETRRALYPDLTDEEWKPLLPGDSLPAKLDFPPSELGDLLWPRLSDQLCPYGGERRRSHVRLGNYWFAPVVVSLGPSQPRYFDALLARVIDIGDIPFRASFLIEGHGVAQMQLRVLLARLTWWASADNRNLIEAHRALTELRNREHEIVAGLRMVFCTWAREERAMQRNLAALVRAVQNWGNCDIEEPGDALGAVLASVPAYRTVSPAPRMAVPLGELARLLPITRPASPWTSGPLILRSSDGKPIPFDVRSSRQAAHVVLGNAPMRMGKSVFSNMMLLGLVLHGRNESDLPRIGIIDIGGSSSGLVSLLRGALGPQREHLAVYHRLMMDPNPELNRFAVNPFDLPLGCRWPTATHMTFLENLLLLLLTPLNEKAPPPGMQGMARTAIEFVYRRLGFENPHEYVEGTDPFLDGIIRGEQLDVAKGTTWWDIVDQLFARSMEHEAGLAQRYAVPTLGNDIAGAANDDRVGRVYQGDISGETMAQYFWRQISDATRQYPILAGTTRFDLGEARIVSLDLQDVTQPGTESARRQAAVMYMLARHIVAGRFYTAPEYFEAFSEAQLPRQYRRLHVERARRMKEEVKQVVFDEFHRTQGQQGARDQVLIDIREGPKHNVGVSLFSQMAGDFDEAMRALETCALFFGKTSAAETRRVVEDYGLPAVTAEIMGHRMAKPGPAGADVLARWRTSQGDYVLHLKATAGAIKLWALSTTPMDMALRSRTYDALGPVLARRVLAARFPSGTAEPEIERRIAERRELAGDLAEEQDEVIAGLARELVEEAHHFALADPTVRNSEPKATGK